MSAPPIVADGLDADAVAAILLARQRALAQPPADERAHETLLAFDLGGVTHGLPIDSVRSVAPLPKITRLPHAPAALLGLVAWRGTVVNLFALGPLLDRDSSAPTAMIVLRHDAPRIALAVDALAGVVTVPYDDMPSALTRLVAEGDARLTRVDPALLVETLLPSRLQEG